MRTVQSMLASSTLYATGPYAAIIQALVLTNTPQKKKHVCFRVSQRQTS